MNILRPRRPGFRAVLPIVALVLLAAPLYAGTLQVPFDIHPTVCPNPFNPWWDTRSGIVATAILGTQDLNVANISPSGLVIVVPGGGGLNCEGGGCGTAIEPISTEVTDVAAALANPEFCECTSDGPDAFDDFVAIFDHDAITAAIGAAVPGETLVFCIQGMLNDGTPFEGCDCVYITSPTSTDASSWGKVKATYRN
ncbi:hypothetical protein K8I85_16685 [bacterium]|nr:hypothetical protein [bacterium]